METERERHMDKLSLEELEKIYAGKWEDAQDYLAELKQRYGTDDLHELNGMITEEEWKKIFYLMGH